MEVVLGEIPLISRGGEYEGWKVWEDSVEERRSREQGVFSIIATFSGNVEEGQE